eukprot:11169325-Lingulodinium_polyedra.AAC.1
MPQIRLAQYNPLSLCRSGRLSSILERFKESKCVALTGIARRAPPGHAVARRRGDGFLQFEWGYSTGRFANKACGVLLALSLRHYKEEQVTKVYSPPAQLQGRAGAVRIKFGSFDVLLLA